MDLDDLCNWLFFGKATPGCGLTSSSSTRRGRASTSLDLEKLPFQFRNRFGVGLKLPQY